MRQDEVKESEVSTHKHKMRNTAAWNEDKSKNYN